MARGWNPETCPSLHLSYHAEFCWCGSKSNRQYRDPQKFGELGPRSLRMRRVFDPWKHVFSRCYHWKFCRTRSKGWCVITKILQKSLPLRYPAFKVTQGHWKIGFHTTSYWCSILIMGLSRTVSDIKGDIRKIFSPRVFTAPRRGFPFEFRNGGGVQKKIRMMPLSDRQKLWRYFRLFRHSTGGTGRRDGQTDGRNWQNILSLCVHCMLTRDKKTSFHRRFARWRHYNFRLRSHCMNWGKLFFYFT